MSNVQIIDLVLISINLSIGTIALLFGFQKMPAHFQKISDDMQFLSNKSLKIIGSIMLIGVIVQIYKHVGAY